MKSGMSGINCILRLRASIRGTSKRVSIALLGLVAALASVAFMTTPTKAQSYSILYNFTGGTDGGLVTAGLIRDADGNLYGATEAGGYLKCGIYNSGCGVVFKFSKTGKQSVLYAFKGGTDGADPQAGLVRDAQGNLYGTTARGGIPKCAFGQGTGCGTIFKVDPAGKETVLYRFKGGKDGARPAGTLFRDAAGNLWGTTQYEGLKRAQCFSYGCGTIFRLDPSGKLATYMFMGPPNDGSWPLAGLVANSSGTLYGTTSFGGIYNCGMVFSVNPTKGLLEIKSLHNFDINTADAEGPTGLLVSGSKLYGPATGGGIYQGGAVFELGPAGESVLYSFTELSGDASQAPQGLLARDPKGNLYGTTTFSAENLGYGTVYKLDSNGNHTVLHQFEGFNTDGSTPMSGVIRDSAGNLYGTTQGGGTTGGGTIFKITP